MEIIIDKLTGVETVFIVNEDGTTFSMAKATYDTLVSNSSTPQAGN
jgi:hypothetical protein